MITAVRVALVVFVAISLQIILVSRLSIGGARGDVVLLVAIVAGLEGDADRGAIIGFAAGLTFDLLLNTPVGLSALTYCLVGYVVGSLQSSVLRSTWWIPVLGTIVASAIGVTLFALFDDVLGGATIQLSRVPGIVVVVALLNGLLSRPFRWAMRQALADPTGSRDHFLTR
jgi:rod shape-determining protein MreD